MRNSNWPLGSNFKWSLRLKSILIFCGLICFSIAISNAHFARADALAAPTISNVTITTPNLARYDKFEAQFDIATVATQPQWPYDPTPIAGLSAGSGISVDALFSPDNWTTVITQPAFLYQAYTHSLQTSKDHFAPSGAPRWTARFAPQQSGVWQFRLRAQDAGGVSIYPASGALTFTVNGASNIPSKQHGFLKVSAADRRYFEFQDGTPFIGVGYNDGFGNTADMQQRMQLQAQYKINFLRIWMSGAGLNGSHWTSWAWHGQTQNYLPDPSFDIVNTFNGADVALKLDNNIRCLFTDFWQGGVPVLPNTAYSITARVKVNNVTGPASSGAYGFVVKQAPWSENDCHQANVGTVIAGPVSGSTDWITLTGSYTTGAAQYFLDYLYLTRQNATGGEVYIDDVRVWRSGDPARVNLLREPNANSHLYFDQMSSALWDKRIEAAEQNGIYLKLVIDEKNEWIRNHLTASGTMTTTDSNDNFYAAPNTQSRWLQQAWWRYLIARWGYSTAVHSFEYINEGDPYNGHHYEATNALARYMHSIDPARHLVTTSFWHSFTGSEFWANRAYPDMDYADIHAYISTGWGKDASFVSGARLETRPQYIRTGNASARMAGADNDNQSIVPRGLVIQGQGEWLVRYWMKTSNFTANCAFGSSGGMQRIRWMVDGGGFYGGISGIVPNNSEGKDFLCTSPSGTYDWTQFRSDQDRSGALIPLQYRLVLTDSASHALDVRLENSAGTGGEAWFDDVELVSPSGGVWSVLGQFDITPMDEDTAWFNRAYGEALGGRSLTGARMPLVRGETGVDSPTQQTRHPQLNNDTQGIWLHNNVWGQVNPGGMYDLMWWANDTIDQNASTGRFTHIYTHYLTYRNFMEGIPLSNGFYNDAQAQTSSPNLRVWGQRDDFNGRIHLWAQNMQHTWTRVVNGPAIPAVNGTITLTNIVSGTYRVTWWNTYTVNNPVFLTQTIPASGTLSLSLPSPLSDDVAIKIERVSGGNLKQTFLPLVRR